MSRVFTTARDQAADLASRVGVSDLVFGLCAAWCGTCTEFREVFENLAELWPDVTFVWLDIEDDSTIAGDIDVENFPTLAVFRQGTPVHFGVSLPQEGVIRRLLSVLLAGDPGPGVAVPDEVAALPTLLERHLQIA
jgi:thioredoxin 1